VTVRQINSTTHHLLKCYIPYIVERGLYNAMLSKEEKARTFKKYIDSERFGKATWTTIHIFGNNVVQGIDIIKLLFVLIDRIDRKDIKIVASSEGYLQRIKQQI
jgi:hypothetical protein